MRRRARIVLFVAAALGGCGREAPRSVESPEGARKGGTIEVLSVLQPTTLDPGNAYNSDAYALVLLMHRPLYAYIGSARRPVPDLATGAPSISPDGRTVTVGIRAGVRFAAPVDREVVAADVRNGIERGFRTSVANPYARNYLGAIRGVDDFVAGRAEHVAGIEVPDDRTIRFRLVRSEAQILTEALALPISAPVPAEVSDRADAKSPSTYGRNAVPTGPYRLKEFSSTRVILERNPDWAAESDIRPALPDRFVWTKVDETTLSARQVLSGKSRLFGPGPPPGPGVLKQLAEGKFAGQSTPVAMPSYFGLALNTRRPPLDKLDVRRAVVAALDRAALLRSVGGKAAGKVATHLIPPGVPGHSEAGGATGPDFDHVRTPGGDRSVAAAHLRAAGHASGRFEGSQTIDVVGVLGFPFSQLVEQQLEPLGFDVQIRDVGFPQIPRLCTGTAKGAHICFQSWGMDFFDPQTLMENPFGGRTAGQPGTPNFAGLADPEADAAMARARTLSDPAERARAWGEIDRRIMELAAFVPIFWPTNPLIRSADVVTVGNPWLGGWDLNLTGLRR